MAFSTSLEGQAVSSLVPYATSSFSKHSLISTVLVVQNVVNGKFDSFIKEMVFCSDCRQR